MSSCMQRIVDVSELLYEFGVSLSGKLDDSHSCEYDAVSMSYDGVVVHLKCRDMLRQDCAARPAQAKKCRLPTVFN